MTAVRYIIFIFAVSTVQVECLKPFTAAVWEHVPAPRSPGEEAESVIKKNLQIYAKAAQKASGLGVDIIVFPEDGILSSPSDRNSLRRVAESVPDPRITDWNPCVQNLDDFPVMKNLSCLARSTKLITVVNYIDIQPCIENNTTKCPTDNVYIFNTDVVFDGDGKLLARFHKNHLYYELTKNVPPTPEHIWFKTKFGTVAVFTCFDIIFKDAVEVIEESKAEIVVYPTWWFDTLPLQGAVITQQGFAMRMNVTMLAANIHVVSAASVGSGIYYGEQGAVNFTISEDSEPRLLVSRVPFKSDASSSPRFHGDVPPAKKYKPHYSSFLPQAKMIQLEKPTDNITLCQDGLCCGLTYEKSPNTTKFNETYYFVVFNGTNVINNHYRWCVETCFVARCEPSQDGSPCRIFPHETQTTFKSLNVIGRFSTRYVYPMISASGINLPAKALWEYNYLNVWSYIGFNRTIQDPILTLGLNGRCYDRDPPYHQ